MKMLLACAFAMSLGCGSDVSISTRFDECAYMTDDQYDSVVAVVHEANLLGIDRAVLFLSIASLEFEEIACAEAIIEDEYE